jgi:serine/threonine protein kinase
MEGKTLCSGVLLVGRYLITSHLGEGGCGQTYLAEDRQFPGKPKCVVKQFKPQLNSPEILQNLQRLFTQEAEVLSELGHHSQIPNLLAHFEEDSQFYLVQEWVDGQDLSHELQAGHQLSEHYVASILYDILDVLEVVHKKGVIHRDIKPSNIMRRKADSKIVLIDFGAVKEVSQLTTAMGQFALPHTISIGTPGFMPNEQRAGTPKLSSDIYAVGMLGIQALTGISPSELPSDPKSGEVAWHEQASVSAALRHVLDNMIRYDFRQRYPSATEAKEALAAWHNLRFSLPDLVPPTHVDRPNEFMATQPQESVPSHQRTTVPNPHQQSPQSTTPERRKIPFRAFGWGVLAGLIGGVAGTLYLQSRFMPQLFNGSHANSLETGVPTPEPIAPSPSGLSETPPVVSSSPLGTVPSVIPSIEAKPAVAVDYGQLKTALAAGQWKIADQLTRDLVLSLTGRAGSILRIEDVEQIPCSDMKMLDQLWEQSSRGKFGFNAQRKVWQSVVGKAPETVNVDSGNNDKILVAYVAKVGWFYSNSGPFWYPHDYGELTFALNASPGHLPAKVFLQTDSPNDTTQLKGAAVLVPSLAQRVAFCEGKQ